MRADATMTTPSAVAVVAQQLEPVWKIAFDQPQVNGRAVCFTVDSPVTCHVVNRQKRFVCLWAGWAGATTTIVLQYLFTILTMTLSGFSRRGSAAFGASWLGARHFGPACVRNAASSAAFFFVSTFGSGTKTLGFFFATVVAPTQLNDFFLSTVNAEPQKCSAYMGRI